MICSSFTVEIEDSAQSLLLKMTEDKTSKTESFTGGEVLFAGGTDWGFIGRNLGGSKKKGDADVSFIAFNYFWEDIQECMLSGG